MNIDSKCDKIQTNRRPLKCPRCTKGTLLYLLPDTQVKSLPVKCKMCGEEFVLNIPSVPVP